MAPWPFTLIPELSDNLMYQFYENVLNAKDKLFLMLTESNVFNFS